MTEVFEFVRDNVIVLSFLGTAIVGVINLYQFVRIRKDNQRQTDYINYHALIERLNLPETGTGHPLLDKQKSAAFELRYYPKYKYLTHDILSGWIPRVTDVHGLSSIMKETLEILKVPYEESNPRVRIQNILVWKSGQFLCAIDIQAGWKLTSCGVLERAG